MNSTGYKFLGYAAWHGGKWYVRRRYLRKLPSARRGASALALTGLGLGGAALVLIARRGGTSTD